MVGPTIDKAPEVRRHMVWVSKRMYKIDWARRSQGLTITFLTFPFTSCLPLTWFVMSCAKIQKNISDVFILFCGFSHIIYSSWSVCALHRQSSDILWAVFTAFFFCCFFNFSIQSLSLCMCSFFFWRAGRRLKSREIRDGTFDVKCLSFYSQKQNARTVDSQSFLWTSLFFGCCSTQQYGSNSISSLTLGNIKDMTKKRLSLLKNIQATILSESVVVVFFLLLLFFHFFFCKMQSLDSDWCSFPSIYQRFSSKATQ